VIGILRVGWAHVKLREAHFSSRNLFTIRISGFPAPAFDTKSNAPLRTFIDALVASDCRAGFSSDFNVGRTTPA
jgi:hypothetical protein